MAQQSLIEYVINLLKSGYDAGTIRSTLINAGYSPAEVNNAITYATKAQPAKKVLLSLKTILIAAALLILLALIILGAIKILTPEPKTISITVSPTKTELYPGSILAFSVQLTSNTDRTEQVLLTYELIDTKEDKIISTKQDKPEIGAQRSLTAQIALPAELKTGAYELRTILSYKLKTEQRKFSLTVIELPEKEEEKKALGEPEKEEIEQVQCPESCDDFNPCTTDFCDKGLCRHNPKAPCCGNGICEEGENSLNCPEDCSKTKLTPQEIITQATKVSQSDPEAAAMLCNKLTRQNDISLCFSEVAKTSGKSVICENIQTQDNRDTCYMEFALEGEYAVCTKISNSYLSKSCNSLKRSSTMLAQAEGMAELLKQSPE